MIVVVMSAIVIGGEDEGEELLLPHVASHIVQHFGLHAVEAGAPAAHLSVPGPGGAMVPVLDEVVFGAVASVKGGDVDSGSKAVVAELAAPADLATVVRSQVHNLRDTTLFQVVAEAGDALG